MPVHKPKTKPKLKPGSVVYFGGARHTVGPRGGTTPIREKPGSIYKPRKRAKGK